MSRIRHVSSEHDKAKDAVRLQSELHLTSIASGEQEKVTRTGNFGESSSWELNSSEFRFILNSQKYILLKQGPVRMDKTLLRGRRTRAEDCWGIMTHNNSTASEVSGVIW